MTDTADTTADTTAPGWEGILDPGERILWQGRPQAGLYFAPGQIGTAAFSLFFSGFAVFWMTLAAQAGGSFWMFGLIHFSVGIVMFWSAVLGPTIRRRRTWYTLTDRRAFIATDLPLRGRQLKHYPITESTQLTLTDDQPPTLHFAREDRRGGKGRRYTVDVGFERIEDGEKVYSLMRKLRRSEGAI